MKRAIEWFATNNVAANLLVVVLIAGGLLTAPRVKREVFPEIEADVITVAVEYPGAAPEEVEEGICVRIEEQLQGLDGIERVRSTAAEGACGVTAELWSGVDGRRVLDDVKAQVDAIDTFPDDAEKPVVQQVVLRRQVINVAVSGETDEKTLKVLGERVRDELTALPGITMAELANARPYEISIEVAEEALRRHGITFDDVVRAVRQGSADLPGGSIKTEGAEILLRTKGQAYRGEEFEKLVLLARPDGTRLTLGEVARVVDGFEETDQWARFDGKPAVLVQVFRTGDQSALAVADAVRRYVREAQRSMPEGIALTVWEDNSQVLRSRLNTLLRNGRDGFILVLLLLALFLRLRLAAWVILGVPVSFLGAIWLMPVFDLSVNLISLFAFVVVLGILVDDAIVVGDNVYTHRGRTAQPLQAAIMGTQEVAVPVIFGVLTTVAAFVPMLMVPGTMGKFIRVIPIVVISALVCSLVESMLVLPAHLGHGWAERAPEASGPLARAWEGVQRWVAAALAWFINRLYRPTLEFALDWRYLTAAISLAALLITGSLIPGRWITFTFFPETEGDNVVAYVTMPAGTPARATAKAVERLETAARAVAAELEVKGEGRVIRHLMASVGEQPYRRRQSHSEGMAGAFAGAHLGEINVELAPSEKRRVSSAEVATRWRARTGAIPDAVEVLFSSVLVDSGEPINAELRGADIEELRAVARTLRTRLAEYPGVYDIADSFREGKQELEMRILPGAEALGLTLSDLGRQVRQGFYGAEAQRIQRGRDDVRVMVRYPYEHRRSLADIENMRIRLPDGTAVPFAAVAQVDLGRGFAAIRRTDRQRVVNVTANVDSAQANANEIVRNLRDVVLPQILADHPRLTYTFEGEQRRQADTLRGLGRGYILALLTIYALLAVPLRSYVQPLIIMTAIPFGLIGAVWGHLLMGRNLSIFSIIGMVALTGVVVNDSLVLVSYINARRAEGVPLTVAVRRAGVARFRAILLTSLTTFAGLTPLMLERSMQAQFLIPMAISLAFGVMFSTFVSLLVVPASYVVLEDLKRLPARVLARRSEPAARGAETIGDGYQQV